LEAAVEKAESDMAVEPEIPRPKYWQSDLEHYEWVFRLIHEHGRSAGAEDAAFMAEFEAQPDFNSYRQRFEDLKLLFNL
jgi:hypothetical protein